MKTSRLRDATLATVAALALAACAGSKEAPEDEARAAFDDVRTSIQTVVSDPGRAAQATALVDEMERNFREMAANVNERRAAILKLSANYDTPEAELEAALARERDIMRANRKHFSDTRRRLAEILTDEEWDKLQKQRSKALEKAIAAALS